MQFATSADPRDGSAPPSSLPLLPFSAWLLPIGIAVFAGFFFHLQLAGLEVVAADMPDTMRDRLSRIAAFATVTRLVTAALETGLYCGWWASWGWRLPFLRACFWMLALAMLDLISANLLLLAREHGSPLSEWLAVLAGPNAIRTGPPGTRRGLWMAFGGFGLLSLARIVGTAWVQGSLLRVRLAPVLASVAGFWLATRLVMWWGVDLLAGRSSLP